MLCDNTGMRLVSWLRAAAMYALLVALCACGGQTSSMAPSQLLPAASGPGAAGDATSVAPASAERTLEAPDKPTVNEFLGINDRGDIADTAGDATAIGAYVVHPPYSRRDFKKIAFAGGIGTAVTAINNAGTIVGYYTDAKGSTVAFMNQHGSWTHYAGPGQATVTKYLGINDAGVKVGFYTDRRGVNRGFEIGAKNGDFLRILPPRGVSVTPAGINHQGEVVGYMTTSHGSIEGFLLQAGKFTEFSYPGAADTKALGTNKRSQIVGSYVDASGRTHGFVLRDAATSPRWQSVDAAKSDRFTVLTGINARGDLVGYYRDKSSHTRALLRAGSQQAPLGVPLVIPVWGQGGDPQDTDPGAVPDQHLFAAILDTSGITSKELASNCPGVSSTSTCEPYKYVNFSHNHCSTVISLAAYQWANSSDEDAFLHAYPNEPTKKNRLLAAPPPRGQKKCWPSNADSIVRMNLGDSKLNVWLYKTVWTGTNYLRDFPSPYGAMEDTVGTLANIVVGGDPGVQVSTEYGSGVSPSGFANQVGSSQYHAATDFESAIGTFVNGACGATCVDMALNGVATGAGNVGECSDISAGHCHNPSAAGLVDDQAAIDNICRTVSGGNLKFMMAERPIFAGRLGFEFLNSQSVTTWINTNANLYTHTSDGCANTKIVDIEPSSGEGGLGDITGGYRVRLAALAWRWLVPDPATGIPDRVIADQLTERGTRTEVPYFFEDTLVPFGAEAAVPKFVWNGKTKTVGGGCPSVSGDSGGAVALLVQCVSSAGIYCQQYAHLYINGADNGATAACFNTSTTSENIVSSWFKHDPISSYQYVLALQGGEMTSVPFQGVSGGSIAMRTCTSKQYCTGSNSLSSQVATFKGDGTDALCGQCGVILLEDE